MKKITLFLSALLIMAASSCRKKEEVKCPAPPPKALVDRIDGSWGISVINYNTTVDLGDLGLPPINLVGVVEGPTGEFVFNKSTSQAQYSTNFSLIIDVGLGFPLPVPINLSGSGGYSVSADEKMITVNESSKTTELRVLTNTPQVMVLRTTYPVEVQLLGELPVDLTITVVKD